MGHPRVVALHGSEGVRAEEVGSENLLPASFFFGYILNVSPVAGFFPGYSRVGPSFRSGKSPGAGSTDRCKTDCFVARLSHGGRGTASWCRARGQSPPSRKQRGKGGATRWLRSFVKCPTQGKLRLEWGTCHLFHLSPFPPVTFSTFSTFHLSTFHLSTNPRFELTRRGQHLRWIRSLTR
jgi:hypothetical protein